MPTLPTVQLRQQAPQARYPEVQPSAAAYLGKGLSEFGNALQRIQEASDVTESDRVAGEINAEIKNTIRQKELEIVDPVEFQTSATTAITELRDTKLGGLSSSVRSRVQNKIAAGIKDASGDIEFKFAQKQIAKAQGNSGLFLEQKERELLDTFTPEEQAKKFAEIDGHLGDAVRAGVYTPAEAAKRGQGIRERQAFFLAKRELEISTDPVRDLTTLAQKYPNIDRMKIVNELNSVARGRQKEIDEMQEKVRKQIKEENLSADYSRAISGQMTPLDFEATVKARRYTPAEANSIKNAMEEGGVTDPQTLVKLENEIYQGRLRDQTLIATHRSLDRKEKSRLMGLIESQLRQDRAESRQAEADKKIRHFSNSPEYQQAIKEYRAAISTKGELMALDDRETQRYNFGLRQIWDRVANGEDAMKVSQELVSRLTPREMAGNPPTVMPRFKDDKELIAAAKKGIPARVIAQEAELLLQWEKWNAAVSRNAQAPKTGGDSGRRNSR